MGYQLLVLGPDAACRLPQLENAFRQAIFDMGLDPNTDARLITEAGDILPKVDWAGVPVTVWCGKVLGPNESVDDDHKNAVSVLLKKGYPVFPVAESIIGFEKTLPDKPPELRELNGDVWSQLDSIVANLLQAFGLMRSQRRVFISYRRAESRGVAVQLFDALQDRRFETFLDTASIQSGARVQQQLHGRLANMDLVVLLHTSTAIDSDWVYEELVAAQKRGTEIVHVLWPGIRELDPTNRRWESMSLSEPFELDESDLVRAGKQQDDRLTDAAVKRLIPAIERARIRSVRSRRDRVVRPLLEAANRAQLSPQHYAAGRFSFRLPHLSITTNTQPPVQRVVIPSDGIPDSREVFNRTVLLSAAGVPCSSVTIAYDELGVSPEDLQHLKWLNRYLDLKSVSVAGADQWMSTP